MLDKFSETALNEAREYYKEHAFRSDTPKFIEDSIQQILDNGLDFNHLFLSTANTIVWSPNLREFFDELYKTDKIRFYTKARNHELYNNHFFTNKSLAMEVSMRRAFGILLCCFEDEEILEKIIKCIEKEYPWIKQLSKKYDEKEVDKKQKEFNNRHNTSIKSPNDGSMALYLFQFVLFAKYGYTTRKTGVWRDYALLNYILLSNKDNLNDIVDNKLFSFEENKDVVIPRDFKKLQSTITTGGDLNRILTILDREADEYSVNMLEEKVSTIHSLLNNCCANFDDSKFSLVISRVDLFANILALHKLNFMELLWQYKIDVNDRNFLVNQIVSSRKEASKYLSSDITIDEIDVEDYIISLLAYFLVVALQDSRDFYFKNNSETEYYEIQKYQDKTADMELEIEKFNSALSEKDKEIEFLKKQIEDLKNAESKETKDIVKPYNEEISFLNKQVEDLKEKLSAEQEKTDELNKLRTFAFSVRSEDVVAEKEVSLSELIKDKKITIIGGHTNWQNKMKKKYPKLNLLDGHSTSFDLQTLTTSDFVLLYTGNMSHTVYYKMIDTLRTSDVKYDYIGKYNNVNLLEQEIAEILK